MTRVAVLGASGYTGGELLRLLLAHPGVEVVQATSDPSTAGPGPNGWTVPQEVPSQVLAPSGPTAMQKVAETQERSFVRGRGLVGATSTGAGVGVPVTASLCRASSALQAFALAVA